MAKLCSLFFCLSVSLNYYFFTCLAKNITTDELSLLAFKSSITLDPYHVDQNWSTSSSLDYNKNLKLDDSFGFNFLTSLITGCTSLKYLSISEIRLNSDISSSFWSLKDILQLNLSSNALIENLPMEISKLRVVVQLDLSGNQISSNIPETIGSLTTLQTLSLARNKLNGAIPTSLGEMSKIHTGTLATIGYVAPEYGSKGIVSVKGDVHKKEAYG
ncbi:hypothetical protein P8452_71927 [Trifolium repens]|nr:hypothetical protein P8452_71927 [Trifolium repens]